MVTEMRFDTFNGESSISDLVKRFFKLQGSEDEVVKKAQDALVAANPQLADLEHVPVGSIIAIPDTGLPFASGQSAVAAALLRAFASNRLLDAVNSANRHLSEFRVQALTATNRLLGLVQLAEIQAFAESNPELKRVLSATIESANARLKLIQINESAGPSKIVEPGG